MCSIKWNTRTVHCVLTVLCLGLLLNGCGLGGGRGNLDAGTGYQAEGKYRAAYIEAKQVLQHDKTNGAAWLLLGQASLMLGNPKEALGNLHNARDHHVEKAQWVVPLGRALRVTGQYDKLLEIVVPDRSEDPEVRRRVYVLRGDAHLGLKQPARAKQSYQAALKLAPADPRAQVGLAKVAAIENDPDTARKHVEKVLAGAPENPQAWVAKGDLAFDAGNFADAESDYRKVLGFKHPDWLPQDHFYALTRLANAQAQQGRLDQAMVSIKTLEKMSPQQPYPHYLHAVVLYKQGHLDDALSQLQQVLKVQPDNTQAQLLMGTVNYAQGNYGQAEMNLSNVMGMDRKNTDARRLLALTLYREGRSRQALETLRPAIPGTPSDTGLLALLQKAATGDPGKPTAGAFTTGTEKSGSEMPAARPSDPSGVALAQARKDFAKGDLSETIHLLQDMPEGDASTETQRRALLVMAHVRNKRPDKAVKAAAEQVEKHPDESAAHLLYGTALVAADKLTEARVQYLQASKLDPDDVAALLSLASLDSLEGHDKDAAGRYEAALQKDPRNAVAMRALARLALRHGDKAQAIQWFRKAIDAAPQSTAAYVGLVMLYSESGRFDEASDTAKRLVEADPDNPAALNTLGAAQLNAGHPGKALKPLQEAVKIAPSTLLYRTNLARAQILNKHPGEARDNLAQVIKADPAQVTATTLLAFLKLQDHDFPGAIHLAQTLQKQPATKAAGFSLEGDLYMAGKSYDKALQAYRQGLKIHSDRSLVIRSFQAERAGAGRNPESVLLDWLTRHPHDVAIRLLLGQYYGSHEKKTRAAGQYAEILKTHPSNLSALNNLAWIYAQQGNPEALALAERAYKLAPGSPGVADTYGWSLIAGNQPGTALPILMKAAKAAPEAAVIHYHLAVAQVRTGDKTGARDTLEMLRKSGADFPEKQAAEDLYRDLNAPADGRAGKS